MGTRFGYRGDLNRPHLTLKWGNKEVDSSSFGGASELRRNAKKPKFPDFLIRVNV